MVIDMFGMEGQPNAMLEQSSKMEISKVIGNKRKRTDCDSDNDSSKNAGEFDNDSFLKRTGLDEENVKLEWNNLPFEVKMIILYFVINTNDVIAAICGDNYMLVSILFEYLSIIRSINKEIRAIAYDKGIFDIEKISRYILDQGQWPIINISSYYHIDDLSNGLILAGICEKTTNVRLVHAIYLHKIAEIQHLIKCGLTKAYLNDCMNELIIAAASGNVNILKLLLESHSSDVNDVNGLGKTALMFAAKEGHVKIAEYLLNNGADLDLEDDAGETAFTYAVIYGHKRMEEFLLNQAAKVNEKNDNEETPLMLTVENED